MALIRPSGFPERAIQKFARAIACKHAASAVRAMSPRSQTYNEQLCGRIAKPGDRFTPVLISQIGATLDSANLLSVADQTRAGAALNDLFREHA